MTFIAIFRYIALGTALSFGLIALGLTAHWTQGTLLARIFFDFEIVGIITGGLSALALPTLQVVLGWSALDENALMMSYDRLVVGLIRRQALTSMIMVELPVLTVLWVLWLVTAALVAQWGNVFYPFGCGNLLPGAEVWCREFFAIEGLSFIIWIALFLYTLTLLIFSLVGQSRGNPVWTVSANEAIFFDRPGANQNFVPNYDPALINSNASYITAPLIHQYLYPATGTVPMAQTTAALNQHSVTATLPAGAVPMHSGYPEV